MDRNQVLKTIFVVSQMPQAPGISINAQTVSKELNIVKLKNGVITYHFGLWHGDKVMQGMSLSYQDVKHLAQELNKQDVIKENELIKFQKDYIQQKNNGEVIKKKEKDLI